MAAGSTYLTPELHTKYRKILDTVPAAQWPSERAWWTVLELVTLQDMENAEQGICLKSAEGIKARGTLNTNGESNV